MKTIKILQEQKIKLNGTLYKPYTVGELPPSFGYKNIIYGQGESVGMNKWFNYKGLTYVRE
jgi:hypothetical protein|tara:strand:- start:194 stop:376 length:183 start_codon:yes stop_codon:yes gene_type:complete